jgi:oxygen-independent coproporphyrinogen-3 oxidase
MEGYFERVVETLGAAGYRWYETANFCRTDGTGGAREGAGRVDGDPGRDLRAHHNLGYWQGRDYLGVGIGAVSTLGWERRRNAASIGRYVAAIAAGEEPPREVEPLDRETKARERVMLGLRLDEPLPVAGLDDAIDAVALERMVRGGLAVAGVGSLGERTLALTTRGRFLGGGVTAELLA